MGSQKKRKPKNSLCILLLLAVSLPFSCTFFNNTEKQLEGIWLGVYQEYYDQKVPIPVILDFLPGGKLKEVGLNNSFYQENTWGIKDGNLMLDTLALPLTTLTPDVLVYSRGRNFRYARFPEPKGVARESLIQFFTENPVLEATDGFGTLTFHPNDSAHTYFSEDIGERCWQFEYYKDRPILYLRDETGCSGYYGHFHFIRKLDGNALHTLYVNETGVGTRIFQGKPDKVDQEINHAKKTRCSFGVIYNHYSISDAHEKGGNYLADYFLSNYEVPDLENRQSGFLSAQLLINCKGEICHIDWEGMDKAYQAQQFHPKIIEQLNQMILNVGGWVPIERSYKERDAYKSINFRIENNHLVDIAS